MKDDGVILRAVCLCFHDFLSQITTLRLYLN